MPCLYHLAYSIIDCLLIITSHAIRFQTIGFPINQNNGHPSFGSVQIGMISWCRKHYDAIHLFLEEEVHLFLFSGYIFIGISKYDLVPLLTEYFIDIADNIHRKVVGDIGNQKPNLFTLIASQALCKIIGNISQFVCSLFYPVHYLTGDISCIVKYM